jgi:GTPase
MSREHHTQDNKVEIREKAILVGAGSKYGTDRGIDEGSALDELRLLAETAGAEVVGALVQARDEITPRYYIGSGKAEELRDLVEATGATTVIFDNDLSPAQVSNHQNLLNVKVIDRSGLILDIFALRARTSEAKTQVELAQLKHLLPRLTRQWTHLSRQVGGIGVRGPGETQLEVDRRRVRERIKHLTAKLERIEKQSSVSRGSRQDSFAVTLVGYTNAGKSTLFNTLSKSDAPVEDKLFKTLDTMSRRISLPYLPEIIISDTVGFIRDLPHELVASFNSTLADVRGADVLLHVIDVTNPDWEHQRETVEKVLSDIGAGGIETVQVFNKIDKIGDNTRLNALRLRFPEALFVSARMKQEIDTLSSAIRESAFRRNVRVTVDIPPGGGAMLGELYKYGTVLETTASGDSLSLTCMLPKAVAHRLGLV